MATLQDFISRVVPWPGPHDEGFVNIHWTAPSGPGMRGRPYTKVEDFVGMVPWCNKNPKWVKDVYFCLSRQRDPGKVYNGKYTARRTKQGAVALKAIWLDIDVGKEGAYATLEEALEALTQFVAVSTLPAPSALVASGGGLHVYWISEKPLSPEAWRPFAFGLKQAALYHGLKCDAGLTTDEARVLRVPETFNYKFTPPKPVRLLALGQNYQFDVDLACIYKPELIGRVVTVTVTPNPAFAGAPATGFDALEPEEFSGLGYEDVPLDWQPLIGQCAFVTDAIATGGKDYTQPMWNLSTLLATFLEDGHALAHKFGSQHAGYSPDSTDALWDRKQIERRDRGIGWPSCSAIQSAGCKACQSCPHFGKIKSPLSLSVSRTVAPQSDQGEGSGAQSSLLDARPNPNVTGRVPAGAVQTSDLPEDYRVDGDGSITWETIDAKGNDKDILLTESRMFAPWAEGTPRPALHFLAETSKGVIEPVVVESQVMGNPQALARSLGAQGVSFKTKQTSQIGSFYMDYRTKLVKAKEALKTVPFGWLIEDGKETGFAYASKLFKPDGTDVPSNVPDASMRLNHTPIGDPQPWHDAWRLIYDQNRPELEVLTAVAFAAPLMEFVGHAANCTISAHGNSGGNKSTAVELGLSVWGHPKRTKHQPGVSRKSLLKKMGELRNLPIYWDDIKKGQLDKVVDTVEDASHGQEGGTLTQNREQREQGTWQSLLVVSSNECFGDAIVKRNRNDAATLYRTFEFKVEPVKNPTPDETVDATQLMAKLFSNYGHIGEAYARYIIRDPVAIRAILVSMTKVFGNAVKMQGPERFWVHACAAIIVGVEIAEQLGVPFHKREIKQFLYDTFLAMRKRVEGEAVVAGTMDHTYDNLTEYLKSQSQNTIWTVNMSGGKGHPRKVELIHGPDERNVKGGINVQWVRDAKLLRFSRKSFYKWVEADGGSSPSLLVNEMTKHLGLTRDRANLTAGTPYQGGPETIFIIPVTGPLTDMLNAHTAFSDVKVVTRLDQQDAALPTTPVAPAQPQPEQSPGP